MPAAWRRGGGAGAGARAGAGAGARAAVAAQDSVALQSLQLLSWSSWCFVAAVFKEKLGVTFMISRVIA